MSTERNAVVPFNYNGHQLSTITDDQGDVWFIAKEVAEILNYSDASKMCERLDEDEKSNRQIRGLGSPTGGRGVITISESGLYEAIFGSSKVEAKAFKKWVKTEVLPAIRKTGKYEVKPNPVAQLDTEIAKAVGLMAEALAQALETAEQTKETVKLLVAERRLTLQQEVNRQKLLDKAQTKRLLKEAEEMTIAEIRQHELLRSLNIGKKSALSYQEETGIPMQTTLRDIKKLREQGHNVQVQDTIYGMLYGLFVGGKLMRNYLPED